MGFLNYFLKEKAAELRSGHGVSAEVLQLWFGVVRVWHNLLNIMSGEHNERKKS
jgi:hypothetical protein